MIGKKDKAKKHIPEVVLKWIKKSQDPKKTYIIAVLHKPNKKIYEAIVPLETDVVYMDKKPYYAGTDSIFYKEYQMKKKKFNVPYVDLYEGYAMAVHPSKDLQDHKFSQTAMKSLWIFIENKVMETRKKGKNMSIKQIIMAILVGGAALYIIGSMF